MNWQDLCRRIFEATGQDFRMTSVKSLAGGDINSAYKLQGVDGSFFVKINRAELSPMFAAEAAGLVELANSATVRVPKPIIFGVSGEQAFLVLEDLALTRLTAGSERELGRQLALMHQPIQDFFGWHQQNTIGSTPQLNPQSSDWVDFWRRQRLGYQLSLAAKNGFHGRLQTTGERLCADLSAFFSAYHPYPSLLHGDLWAGNASADNNGLPVIYDPACYYGDRETDIAMTELFGGFGADFYSAYQQSFALDSGYKTRKTLYNLYHILNHLNLFGSGYLSRAQQMISSLLSELG